MAFNGSGLFNIDSTGQPVSANTLIESSVFNALTADLATGLSNCVTKDGQQTVTANLPMATYRHTGVGNAVARTDYAAAGQVQDGKLNWVDGGGTADAITATYSPSITALVDGQLCCVRATAANATTTPTFSPNGLTARTIVKVGGTALAVGEIVGDGHELILRYDLTNTRWELINPRAASLAANTFTGLQTWKASADIASAATVDLSAATGNVTRITGTTAVSAWTMNAGQWHMVIADGALPLTYHATTNKLNTGGSNYTCAAGDRVLLHKDNSGIVQATIFPTSGRPVSAGHVVQRVEGTPYTTYNSSATAMPYDDTIPQNTEGSEWVTVTITPKSASNRIVIDAHIPVISGAASTALTAAIFQDSTANALAVSTTRTNDSYGATHLDVKHEMAAGTTSATTFKLRAGSHDGSTMYVNGNNSARKYGGIAAIRISVTEYAA